MLIQGLNNKMAESANTDETTQNTDLAQTRETEKQTKLSLAQAKLRDMVSLSKQALTQQTAEESSETGNDPQNAYLEMIMGVRKQNLKSAMESGARGAEQAKEEEERLQAEARERLEAQQNAAQDPRIEAESALSEPQQNQTAASGMETNTAASGNTPGINTSGVGAGTGTGAASPANIKAAISMYQSSAPQLAVFSKQA